MRFMVLGATGATGGLLVERAIATGHEIVAYSREPGRPAAGKGVSVVAGDVRDTRSLAAAMTGTDAVISTLGLGRTREPGNLITDSTRALVAAAEDSGVKRLVVMSAFGVGSSLAKGSLLLRLLYRGGRAAFADKAAGERILTASALDWTLAYPVLLTGKPATGTTRAVDLAELGSLPGVPRISRADVAAFLLDTAAGGTWSRRVAVLTSGTAGE